MPKNNGKHWNNEEKVQLKKLSKANTPTRVIALKLGRTTASIYNEASKLNINLKPVNQSPYGTKKK